MPNERWTKKIMEWQDAFKGKGRPVTYRTDDIKRIITNWIQEAQDRNK